MTTTPCAKIERASDKSHLCRADDNKKDQSYFLYGIAAERLNNFYLPLGDISKSEVREIASEIDLPVADKPESMELCFAGENDYRTALDEIDANKPGDLTDMEGNVLGKHNGIANYTIGQRRGLGYAGGEPLYVGRIDAKSNTVSIGKREDVSFALVTADQLNCLWPEKIFAGAKLKAKIRSYSDPKPCIIYSVKDDERAVKFDDMQVAPSAGQKLVLYDNRTVVAGGTIISARN